MKTISQAGSSQKLAALNSRNVLNKGGATEETVPEAPRLAQKLTQGVKIIGRPRQTLANKFTDAKQDGRLEPPSENKATMLDTQKEL